MGTHVISLGDLVLDVILPTTLPVQPGAHQEPTYRRVEPGGAGNFMIAARRMGLRVSAAGTVGADPFGAEIRAALAAEDIDISLVNIVPDSTSTLVIVLTDSASGAHTFIGHYGEGPEAPYPDGLDERLANANVLYVQGYTFAERRIVPLAFRAMERAEAAKVPVYLDVGPFMAEVSPEHIPWIVQRAAVLLMTEDEVPLAAGGRAGRAAYDYLLEQGPHTLIVKQGAAGCSIITGDLWDRVPGYPSQVVDTVGAGDCFDAAFLAGRLRGLSLTDSARLANAMGAAVVARAGAGRNAPHCADVLAVLAAAGEEIEFSC